MLKERPRKWFFREEVDFLTSLAFVVNCGHTIDLQQVQAKRFSFRTGDHGMDPLFGAFLRSTASKNVSIVFLTDEDMLTKLCAGVDKKELLEACDQRKSISILI